MKINR
jgi:hypothetical protein